MRSRILDFLISNSHIASVLLDSSVLIYYLEGVEPYNLLSEEIFQNIVDENIRRRQPYYPRRQPTCTQGITPPLSGTAIGSDTLAPQNSDGLFYSDDENDYYLLYKPDLDYLRSDNAEFNLERTERIRYTCGENGRKAIVYAAGKYIGQRELTGMGIIFCQLPDALHER